MASDTKVRVKHRCFVKFFKLEKNAPINIHEGLLNGRPNRGCEHKRLVNEVCDKPHSV